MIFDGTILADAGRFLSHKLCASQLVGTPTERRTATRFRALALSSFPNSASVGSHQENPENGRGFPLIARDWRDRRKWTRCSCDAKSVRGGFLQTSLCVRIAVAIGQPIPIASAGLPRSSYLSLQPHSSPTCCPSPRRSQQSIHCSNGHPWKNRRNPTRGLSDSNGEGSDLASPTS